MQNVVYWQAKEISRIVQEHDPEEAGYWSVYRPWINTYRGVSKKYLHGYTAFFEFVENNKWNGWLNLLDKIIFLIWISLRYEIWQKHIQSHTDVYNFNIIYPNNHIATFSFTWAITSIYSATNPVVELFIPRTKKI